MNPSSPGDVIAFDVVHNDGCIRVRIEGGLATILVENINDVAIIVRTINRAVAAGAKRATLYTGEIVNDRLAESFRMKVERNTAWLGGRVTQLGHGDDGPQFRLDFDPLPTIYE